MTIYKLINIESYQKRIKSSSCPLNQSAHRQSNDQICPNFLRLLNILGELVQLIESIQYNNWMEQIRKKFPYFFLCIISLIILFISFSFLYLLVIDIQPWSNTATCIFVVLYLFIFVMLVWSIIEAIRTDPGRVPLQWGFYLESQTKKYCLICHVFKPERTHHCSVCGRCVLNMDHHCPWINTCIGFKNRKPFILMLIYTILATLVNVVAAILSFSAMMDVFQSKLPGKIAEDVIVAIALILNIIILVTIFNFLLFHLRLIFNNQTTIETLELARQGKNPEQAQSIYDLGSYFNWVQVFGTNSWSWFIPIFSENEGPAGDGVIWPKKPTGR